MMWCDAVLLYVGGGGVRGVAGVASVWHCDADVKRCGEFTIVGRNGE